MATRDEGTSLGKEFGEALKALLEATKGDPIARVGAQQELGKLTEAVRPDKPEEGKKK